MNRQGQPCECGVTGPHTNLAGLMPCKCCLEILNNKLISEFVFIIAVLFGTMGQWSMPWELVALAHLRPPPPLLDSPVLDMPLLPGSCPHSPFPLTPWLLLLSQVAQDHQQGNAERQAPTCQGYSLSREVLGSDFVSKFSWFFFFSFTVDSLITKSKPVYGSVSLLFPR